MSQIFSSGVIAVLTLILGACAAMPTAQTSHSSATPIGMLIFGDSGNIEAPVAESGLLPVAAAMKAHCANNPCHFAAMTGDNIYPRGADGLDTNSQDVERFQSAFVEPYGDMAELGEDFRIYMALGNHDWLTSRAGALAQEHFARTTPPFYMDSFFYSVKPPAGNGEIELFIIDTEMMLSTRTGNTYSISDAGIPIASDEIEALGDENAIPQTLGEQAQLEWLKQSLEASTARWKIVVAHHPLWESRGSKHEQAIILRQFLRPIICKHADVYLSGHQHTLEVHRDSCSGTRRSADAQPLLHIISGAAGKARAVKAGYIDWQSRAYNDLSNDFALGQSWGFIYAGLSKDALEVSVIAAPEGARAVSTYETRYATTLKK